MASAGPWLLHAHEHASVNAPGAGFEDQRASLRGFHKPHHEVCLQPILNEHVCGRIDYFPVGDFGKMQQRAWELRLSLRRGEKEEEGERGRRGKGRRAFSSHRSSSRSSGACDGFNTEQQNGEGSSCSAADSSSSPLSPLLCHLSSAASSVNSQGSDRNEATALCFHGFAHRNVAWARLLSQSLEQRWLKMEGFIDSSKSSGTPTDFAVNLAKL